MVRWSVSNPDSPCVSPTLRFVRGNETRWFGEFIVVALSILDEFRWPQFIDLSCNSRWPLNMDPINGGCRPGHTCLCLHVPWILHDHSATTRPVLISSVRQTSRKNSLLGFREIQAWNSTQHVDRWPSKSEWRFLFSKYFASSTVLDAQFSR